LLCSLFTHAASEAILLAMLVAAFGNNLIALRGPGPWTGDATMKTTILTFALAAATILGLATAADAAGRDRTWGDGWKQSVGRVNHGQAPVRAAPVTEGRNATSAATAPVQGVEPYIARQIESNRRSR
jgi:hypothetical protein